MPYTILANFVYPYKFLQHLSKRCSISPNILISHHSQPRQHFPHATSGHHGPRRPGQLPRRVRDRDLLAPARAPDVPPQQRLALQLPVQPDHAGAEDGGHETGGVLRPGEDSQEAALEVSFDFSVDFFETALMPNICSLLSVIP